MEMHHRDSVTRLALWKVNRPEGKMGERKGETLPLPLTCQWSLAWVQAERQRTPSGIDETNHLRMNITTPERTRPINTETRNRITSPTISETTESSHEQPDF